MKKLIALPLSLLSLICFAQKIEVSPELAIQSMSPAEVDSHMSQVANAVSQSSPIRSDEITTINRAFYLKSNKTLTYMVSLSEHRNAEDVASSMRPSFCSGRTNKAFMSKGVNYQYSITTPRQSYNIIFSQKDC